MAAKCIKVLRAYQAQLHGSTIRQGCSAGAGSSTPHLVHALQHMPGPAALKSQTVHSSKSQRARLAPGILQKLLRCVPKCPHYAALRYCGQ